MQPLSGISDIMYVHQWVLKNLYRRRKKLSDFIFNNPLIICRFLRLQADVLHCTSGIAAFLLFTFVDRWLMIYGQEEFREANLHELQPAFGRIFKFFYFRPYLFLALNIPYIFVFVNSFFEYS